MTDILLAIAYTLVAALLLNVWISTKWHTGVKVLLIAIVAVFYIGTYIGIRDIRGWPTEESVPNSFRLLWAKIDEPNKKEKTKGRIYLWVQKLNDEQILISEPRAHQLPYTIKLAEKIQKAMKKTEAGAELNGTMSQLSDQTQMREEAATEDLDRGFKIIKEEDELVLEFTEQLRAALPPKGV